MDIIKKRGIFNNGNQCYFNSTLQALSSCESIYDIIINNKINDNKYLTIIKKYGFLNIYLSELQSKCLNIIATNENPDDEEFLRKILINTREIFIYLDFINIIKALMSNNSESIQINNIIYMLRSHVSNNSFKELFSGEQCDPHECLIYLLDVFHHCCSKPLDEPKISHIPEINLLNNSTNNIIRELYIQQYLHEYGDNYSIFVNHFHNSYLTTINCENCNHNVYNISPLSVIDISVLLDIQIASLQDCMINYFKDELLDDYKCDNCKFKNTCKLNKKFINTSKTLIIELKRFIQSAQGILIKNNIHITYPLSVDINPYLVNQTQNLHYNLNAVISHLGHNMESGHYYCISKKIKTEQWFIEDDINILPIQIDDVLKQSNAYLLFYTLEE